MATLDQLQTFKGLISDPRQALTLRIGVAGNRILQDDQIDRINGELEQIYSDIFSEINQIKSNESDIYNTIYQSKLDPIVRITSSLAEGADRLAVSLDRLNNEGGLELQFGAVLPFSIDEYKSDFLPENSVVDKKNGTIKAFESLLSQFSAGQEIPRILSLDGDIKNRNLAYNQCSQTLVQHADFLIAIYDNNGNQSEGTSFTVNEALSSSIPVIKISNSSGPLTILTADHLGHIVEKPYSKQAISTLIKSKVLFTEIFNGSSSLTEQEKLARKSKILDHFNQFIEERILITNSDLKGQHDILVDKKHLGLKNRLFRNFVSLFKSNKVVEKTNGTKAKKLVDCVKEENDESSKLTDIAELEGAFKMTDALANYYASHHRGTFLSIYVLGAMALFIAATALAFKTQHEIVFGLVLIESLILLWIYLLYKKDSSHHHRWLTYRYLAECFRPNLYLSYLGRSFSHLTDIEAHASIGREFIGHGDGSISWGLIYLETVLRRVGFSLTNIDSKHSNQVRKSTVENWIDGQIGYHLTNASTMKQVAKSLAHTGQFLFYITCVVVGVKVCILGYELAEHTTIDGPIPLVLALLAVLLPLIAATLLSIRSHAEFDISAQRSLSMLAKLNQHKIQLNSAKNAHNSFELAREIDDIAAKTVQEVADWLELYEVKETEPA